MGERDVLCCFEARRARADVPLLGSSPVVFNMYVEGRAHVRLRRVHMKESSGLFIEPVKYVVIRVR